MTTSVLFGPGPSTAHSHPRATPLLSRRAVATTTPISALPRVSSTIAVTGLALTSLAPSLLPRDVLTQAVFSGTLAAAGLGIVIVLRRLARLVKYSRDHHTPRESVRLLVLIGSMIAVTWTMVLADHWQDSLRAAMGMPAVGPEYWLRTLLGATVTFLIVVGIGRATAAVARRLGWIGSAATVVVLVTGFQLVAGPALWAMTSQSYSDADAFVDVSLQRPMSGGVSGGPDSAITWESLGRQGRRFVAAGDQSPSIRTYVGMNSASNVESRAELAVSELERVGGFARSAIVVTVPTGSGWIDENATDGFEERFGGDVAIVGMQYSHLPSWMTFIFTRSAADESAAALFDAIADRIADLPADRLRPALYLYGQSLGSVGGSAIFAEPSQRNRQACGALWAGPPARSVSTAGATVLANTSDPVVWWSPDLILHRPDLSFARRDAPVPQWIPGITFLQTSVDLISALNFSAGHGHRYGTEQGTALPDCT
ncbi:alpha/beta-hydrolase family protein [Rhodococcus marinonascens]|uniref:alpha/beta-hydrolase family protein n=1 Tax=Rhodococcus marinonascens TaxID=38311 RepID=UPI0009350F05|nr:alpha/beta-hydrolase family protein [Rhodococcus marinonascens]